MAFFKIIFQKHFELLFWASALLILFFADMHNENSLCFFHSVGFAWCPGDGIGHSIQSALHFQFLKSLNEHPLGIAAVLIIFNRIRNLISSPKQLVS